MHRIPNEVHAMTTIQPGTKDVSDQHRSERTLAQVIESLPFRGLGGNPQVEAGALPDDELPVLGIPGVGIRSAK